MSSEKGDEGREVEGTKHDFTSVLSVTWVCAQWVKTTLCNEQGGLSFMKVVTIVLH